MTSALFLGAGASVIAGLPTTSMLMDELKTKHQMNPDYSFLTEYNGSDVEILDAEIETFLNYKDTKILSHKISAQGTSGTLEDFKKNLKDLRVDIRNLLFEKLSPEQDQIDLFIQAIKPIMDLSINIQYVFTTNYDMLVEEACSYMGIGVVDGFRRSNDDLRAVWSNYWEPRQGAIQLLKLHGSLNWRRGQGTNVLKETTVSNHAPDDDILVRPTLIRKSYDHPVLCQLFERFTNALQDIDAVIAIGTSFRDKAIVEQLGRHLDRQVLLAISPDAPQDTPNAFAQYAHGNLNTRSKHLRFFACKFTPANVPVIVDEITDVIG